MVRHCSDLLKCLTAGSIEYVCQKRDLATIIVCFLQSLYFSEVQFEEFAADLQICRVRIRFLEKSSHGNCVFLCYCISFLQSEICLVLLFCSVKSSCRSMM